MRRRSRRGMIALLALIALVLALAGVWALTPVEDWLTAERLAAWGWEFRDDVWLPLAVLAFIVLAQQLAVPLTVLVIAAALLLGPWTGFWISFAGTLLGAILTYAVGYGFGGRALRRHAGRRINRISRLLARRGIRNMIIVNLLPVGPYALVNLVAGSSHIRFRAFALGTLLGVWPTLLAVSLLAHHLVRLLQEPAFENVAVTLMLVAAIALGSWFGYHWLSREMPLDSTGSRTGGTGRDDTRS